MSQQFTRADISLANWRTAPFNRWSFQHVSEFAPTAVILAQTPPHAAQSGGDVLAEIKITDPDGTGLTALDHMERSSTDCFVALRDGETLASWNSPTGRPDLPHIIFSISKSVTAVLAGIAAGDGLLDPGKPVSAYVAETKGSAFGDARVRDLLDMTVSLDFDEEYLDADGAFDRYRRAMLWNPPRAGAPEEEMVGFLSTLPKAAREHGRQFYYASPNTDMLGLVVERATGERYADYLARRLWAPMGATGGAYVTVDRAGNSRAAGGVCVTVADLARLGQLMLDGGETRSGERPGAQIVPRAWIDDIRSNGDRQAWVDGNFDYVFPNGRYRSCWYDVGDGRGSFCGIGIHGQWIWVDPASRVVLAKVSSRPEPSDDPSTALEISALGQIAKSLSTNG
jgi:CubicO group peptidase (beta-lactamase class C family)